MTFFLIMAMAGVQSSRRFFAESGGPSEIAKLQTELDRFAQISPIIRQQGLELELGLPDFDRRAEQIEIERGELSQSRATRQRWDELTAMFGVGRSVEQYEVMKREREAFIETIFGKSGITPEGAE